MQRYWHVDGYRWLEGPQPPPEAWRRCFARQTLPLAEGAGPRTFVLVQSGLPDAVPPDLRQTLLEEMVWALLSRPHCDVLFHPLYVTLDPEATVPIGPCTREALGHVTTSGFLAIVRPDAAAALEARNVRTSLTEALEEEDRSPEVFSQALLDETCVLLPGMAWAPVRGAWITRAIQVAKRNLPARHWVWLKRQYGKLRTTLGAGSAGGHPSPDDRPLALRKSWDPPFPRPEVQVRLAPAPGRIPVWIAMHWLDLGGAEKFALDLVRALPRDRYAVHVTTDVPADNRWAPAIAAEVEELLHLPAFVPGHMVGVFCEHYVRTRRIRLLHIHHAPRVYESLFHLRRFHPALTVLDTLHIVELPPHSGGYPEWTMQNFGVFIDHHHVISEQLQRFLVERWMVPREKIDVIRINVDASHFDPARVLPGEIRRRLDLPDDATVVGFVGRFTRQKRPLEFVRMAKLLSDAWRREGRRDALHFVMVGGGKLLGAVERAVRAAGLQGAVHLVDEVGDPRPVYRDCDLVAMPSENEGLALVTYEAMAMATPVFFTDVGAQSELLEPGQLVDPAMPVAPALADRIWPFLLDPTRRRALGERQRAHVLRHHRSEDSMRAMIRLYDRLLDRATADAGIDRAATAHPGVDRAAPDPPVPHRRAAQAAAGPQEADAPRVTRA